MPKSQTRHRKVTMKKESKKSVVLNVHNSKMEIKSRPVKLTQKHVLRVHNSVMGQASRFKLKVTAEAPESTLVIGGKK